MADAIDLDVTQSASAYLLALREELAGGVMKRVGATRFGDLDAEICRGTDSLWLLLRRKGQGGLALRAAYVAGGEFECRKLDTEAGKPLRFEIESVMGVHEVTVGTSSADLHVLRVTTRLRTAAPLRMPYIPRDLYALDAHDDPLGASGNIEASQRGVNSGIVYFRFDQPDFGSALYFQNLTALNPWLRATGTVPSGVVGGAWPELGYAPPLAKPDSSEADPLPADAWFTLSDVTLVLRDWAGDTEQEMARQFVQMLGAAYKQIELPSAGYRDWAWRAERTLRDLEQAPEATIEHYGHRYVMPYVKGAMPDAMVQMSVIAALHDYGKWRGEPVPLEAELKAGLAKFYDPKVKTIRRYLPNIARTGPDKQADAVDSWYLYHPMINLARLALDGEEPARDLLLKSVDYGIRAAHHFDYRWPILYDINDFSVITKARGDSRFGETDVNGIYAYLMMQLFQLTSDSRYLDEAKAAIDAARGLRFDLMYQANLTMWAAVACMRLWRITQNTDYLNQSYVYIAGLLHNCEIWESDLGHARHYRNFLGATCLHDAPYMAMYECFECFAGIDEYLAQSGPDLEPAARMLLSEFCRYALDRAWFYFPDALPKEILHRGEHQSGVIDRKLSFPLEDLYGDGQSPGQIGQEIYGSGSAFVFTTRSFHEIDGAPFRLFSNQFIRAMEHSGHRSLTIQLDGGETCRALLSVVRSKRRKLVKASVTTPDGDSIIPHEASGDRIDFSVPANGRLVLTWE